jgi:hypothetical protein
VIVLPDLAREAADMLFHAIDDCRAFEAALIPAMERFQREQMPPNPSVDAALLRAASGAPRSSHIKDHLWLPGSP